MAACDNLYGTEDQWHELFDFLYDYKAEYLKYMKPCQRGSEDNFRLCYIADIQGWLVKNCKLKWVQEELNDNFAVQTLICGKPHHE